MSSSTSNSKSLLGALTLAALALIGFELYWRARGAEPSVNPSSDRALWAHHRAAANNDPNTLVVLGTSRALFDFDLEALARATGASDVRQLAIAATHPLATLEDLANDPNFTGRILCEMNEESLATLPWESQREYTNARAQHFSAPERWGSYVRARIEERIVMLNPAVSNLNRLKWSHFGITDVRTRWTARRTSACVPGHLMPQEWNLAAADAALASARSDLQASFDAKLARLDGIVRRLHARGIPVVFVRAPVAPQMEGIYEHYLPRAQYWDRMVAQIDAPFIRAGDIAELAAFLPPDGSHLCDPDPLQFTTRLAAIVNRNQLFALSNRASQPIAGVAALDRTRDRGEGT